MGKSVVTGEGRIQEKDPASLKDSGSGSNIYADVESVVVPVGVVVAAPVAVGLESITVSVHLVAEGSMFGNVAINSDSVRFEPLMAFVGPVLVPKGRST